MSDRFPHSALRKWRQDITQPIALIGMVGAGCIAGLAGPFGTLDALSLVPRLVYWVLIVFATYGAAALVAELITPFVGALPLWGRILILGSANSIVIAAIVVGANVVVFGTFDWTISLFEFLITLYAVVMIITGIIAFVQDGTNASAQTTDQKNGAAEAPAILTRLPLDKRGALIALSVEDHYVRIKTTLGEEMLLMRLSDAMRETAPLDGAQVHRSHWVAFAHVIAVERQGDRAILTLTGDLEVPVSRSNMNKIREAGLLPR